MFFFKINIFFKLRLNFIIYIKDMIYRYRFCTIFYRFLIISLIIYVYYSYLYYASVLNKFVYIRLLIVIDFLLIGIKNVNI